MFMIMIMIVQHIDEVDISIRCGSSRQTCLYAILAAWNNHSH